MIITMQFDHDWYRQAAKELPKFGHERGLRAADEADALRSVRGDLGVKFRRSLGPKDGPDKAMNGQKAKRACPFLGLYWLYKSCIRKVYFAASEGPFLQTVTGDTLRR